MSEPANKSEHVKMKKNNSSEKNDFVHFLKVSMALRSCTESFCKDLNELYRSDVMKVMKKYDPKSMLASNSENMDQGMYKEIMDVAESDVGKDYGLCMTKNCMKHMKDSLESMKGFLKTNKMKRSKKDGDADLKVKTTPSLMKELEDLIIDIDEMKKSITPKTMANTMMLVKKMDKFMQKAKPNSKPNVMPNNE